MDFSDKLLEMSNEIRIATWDSRVGRLSRPDLAFDPRGPRAQDELLSVPLASLCAALARRVSHLRGEAQTLAPWSKE